MGRPRKLTPKRMREGAEKYFRSIRRRVRATEMVPTGGIDRYGHPVMEAVELENEDGEPLMLEEYLTPPTLGGVCAWLHIHRNSWNAYRKREEFREAVEYVEDTLHAYLERELLTRDKVQGICFELTNRYGYSGAVTVGSTDKPVRAMDLEQLTDAELEELADAEE